MAIRGQVPFKASTTEGTIEPVLNLSAIHKSNSATNSKSESEDETKDHANNRETTVLRVSLKNSNKMKAEESVTPNQK